MVETVDSIKLADKLQTAAASVVEQRGNEPLRVLIQVCCSSMWVGDGWIGSTVSGNEGQRRPEPSSGPRS